MAKLSHLLVQPTGGSIDDIMPGERVFTELMHKGIPKERLAFALCRIDSEGEERATREYLTGQGYTVLEGCLYNRSGYKTAQNIGKSVLETNFESLNDKAGEIMLGILKRIREVYEPGYVAENIGKAATHAAKGRAA
jgi:chromosome partitioning protein